MKYWIQRSVVVATIPFASFAQLQSHLELSSGLFTHWNASSAWTRSKNQSDFSILANLPALEHRLLSNFDGEKKGKKQGTFKIKRHGHSSGKADDDRSSRGGSGDDPLSEDQPQQTQRTRASLGGEGSMKNLSDEDLKTIAHGGMPGGARRGVDKNDERWLQVLQDAIDPFIAKVEAGMDAKDVLNQLRQDRVHLQGVRMFKRAMLQKLEKKEADGFRAEAFGRPSQEPSEEEEHRGRKGESLRLERGRVGSLSRSVEGRVERGGREGRDGEERGHGAGGGGQLCERDDYECKARVMKERKAKRREANAKPRRSWTPEANMLKLKRRSFELFGDSTPPDIAEFRRDATPQEVAACRPEEVKLAAQRGVAAGTPGSSVWFKHMRKAGGSTVRAILEKAFVAKSSLASLPPPPPPDSSSSSSSSDDESGSSAVIIHDLSNAAETRSWDVKLNPKHKPAQGAGGAAPGEEEEQGGAGGQEGGDSAAVSHGKLAKVGGAPAARGFTLHHQEFDMFPVKCLVTTPRHVYITAIREPVGRSVSLFYYDGPGAKDLNASAQVWHEWMDSGVALMKFERTNGRLRRAFTGAYSYLPDYFVRSLTQQCVVEAGQNSCARENYGQSDFGTPGCRMKEYREPDLELAKAALVAFDLPLVLDHFDLQGPSLLLQRALGVKNVWLGHARTNRRAHNAPPPGVLDRIRSENGADLQLHAWAVEHSLELMRGLEETLRKEHGPSMGGFDVFGPIKLSAPEERTKCLRGCRQKHPGKAESVLKKHCAQICYAISPRDGDNRYSSVQEATREYERRVGKFAQSGDDDDDGGDEEEEEGNNKRRSKRSGDAAASKRRSRRKKEEDDDETGANDKDEGEEALDGLSRRERLRAQEAFSAHDLRKKAPVFRRDPRGGSDRVSSRDANEGGHVPRAAGNRESAAATKRNFQASSFQDGGPSTREAIGPTVHAGGGGSGAGDDIDDDNDDDDDDDDNDNQDKEKDEDNWGERDVRRTTKTRGVSVRMRSTSHQRTRKNDDETNNGRF